MAVYQTLTVTQISQDQEKNCSTVRILWKSTQTGASYNMVEATGVCTTYTNGQEFREDVRYVLPKQTEQVILDKEVIVYHDSQGQAVFEVETWMDTKISAGVVKLYEKLQLTTIPRVSKVLSCDGVIGKTARLAVSRKNSAYCHSIAWSFGSQSGYLNELGQMCEEEVQFTKEGLDFLIPDSFYQEIPNKKSAPCTLTIRTYSDGVLVGEPQSSQFVVTVYEPDCRPILWGIVEDVNEKTVSLTGDSLTLVKYASTARCTIHPQGQKGAAIVKKTIAGKEVEDSLDIPNAELDYIPFTATDSRGITEEYVAAMDVVPYVPVSCEVTAKRLSATSNEAVLTISGNYYPGSFGVAENQISVQYSIGGGEKIPVEVTATEGRRYTATVQLSGMDYNKLYSISVWAGDLLTESQKRTTLKKGVPVFDWGEADFAFHVPVHMDQPLGVASGGTGSSETSEIWENLGFSIDMEPGVEYPTWEKWAGHRVYTKLVDYGSMPNGYCHRMLHFCDATRVIRCFGSTSDGRTLPYGSSREDGIFLYCDRHSVYLDTQLDESGHTAQIQIFYIKD